MDVVLVHICFGILLCRTAINGLFLMRSGGKTKARHLSIAVSLLSYIVEIPFTVLPVLTDSVSTLHIHRFHSCMNSDSHLKVPYSAKLPQ